MNEYTLADCLYSDENCAGEVWERTSRSGCTVSVKCEWHQAELDAVLDGIADRYPDSDFAPAWFDPTYAGESWDSDY